MDMMDEALDFLIEMFEESNSRGVTYRRTANGEDDRTAPFQTWLGTSQTAWINSMSQADIDPTTIDPQQLQRDYILRVRKLEDALLWEPRGGFDFIDDASDGDGYINRFQVNGIQGQSAWRYMRGGYTKMVRVHTKWYSRIQNYWTDAFTGDDGTALAAHLANTGGSYTGVVGTLVLTGGKLTATASPSFGYFNPNQLTTGTTATLNFGTTAGDLDGETIDMGLAVRVSPVGSGELDGYYCTVKIGYTGLQQTTKQLRIVRRRGAVNETLATQVCNSDLDPAADYMLTIKNMEDSVYVRLTDNTGALVSSVAYPATLMNGNGRQGLAIISSLADPSVSTIDDVVVGAL